MHDAKFLPDVVLATWRHQSRDAGGAAILPDGCRDLICHVRPGRPPTWLVSPLMDTTQLHLQEPGELLWGLRLVPGAHIDETALLDAVSAERIRTVEEALPLVGAFCRRAPDMRDVLDALGQSRSVRRAACGLGLSVRSLERLVRNHSPRPPAWWRGLARVRCAARALDRGAPLGEVAADHGFADQAHMTREFRRWFGVPPARFRARPDLMATVRQPGFEAAA